MPILLHLGALRVQLVVHLAGAEDDALEVGLLGGVHLRDHRRLVHDEPAEAAALRVVALDVIKLVQLGLGRRVAQQILGRHHHQRLAELAVHLAAEAVEVVGGGGDVHHLPVAVLDLHARLAVHVRDDGGVVVAHGQEALQPRRRVLGALPVVPVRKQQSQPRLTQPLGLPGGNELVDDDLGSVGKVSELRFPKYQGVGVLHGVAELEAEDSEL
mmetsp:Transcript_5104/g.9616  ORF Transcript_5104/g.9616 Transcript_5104/m.9616 type:complete len:214 (-) Transcript_5104:1214-1855(-)